MVAERAVELAVAYLATYALHATLLCGAAWFVSRRSGLRAPVAVERLLRAALVGGIFTAGIQVGLGFEPIGGRIDLAAPAELRRSPPTFAPAPTTAERATTFEFAPNLQWASAPTVNVELPRLLPNARPLARPAVVRAPAWRPSVKQAVLALWLAGVAVGLALALRDVVALRRTLKWRTTLKGGPVHRVLHELRVEAGVTRSVRLSIAPRANVPLSFGLWRGEIALPPRTLEELDVEEQRAVLAHELAHLVRRDIAWLWINRAIGIVFWFQPLNRLVSCELERRAEFAADRWAHRRIGSGAALASALAEIAAWLIEERRALPAAPMARERSQLARRVETLLAGDALAAVEPRSLSAIAPLACAVVAAWAPAFAASSPHAAPRVDVPVARDTEPASEESKADDSAAAECASDEALPALDEAAFAVAEPTPREVFETAAASLDQEIEALDAELSELESEFSAGERDEAIEAQLALLRARIARLAERRGRLRDLFLALTHELDAASATSPEDTSLLESAPEETR
ncbi:MAG: M48 family metalloprotease [Planctomycetes bacterium]|nr:M48 family metalloprotease [Planctomycetota bacterium]